MAGSNRHNATEKARRAACHDGQSEVPDPPVERIGLRGPAVLLTPEQQLGLSPDWLLEFADERVERAIQAGFVAVWARRVEDAFVYNEQRSRQSETKWPTSWYALGQALLHDPKHFTRYNPQQRDRNRLRAKLQVPQTLLRYRVALALGVREEDLSPSTSLWISASAEWLVRIYGRHVGTAFDRETFLAYGQHLLACQNDFGRAGTDGGAVGCIARPMPETGAHPDAVGKILLAAQWVGETLANHGQWEPSHDGK